MDARGPVIKQIFRSICRHSRYLDHPDIHADLQALKRRLSRKSKVNNTTRAWRHRISTLFEIDQSLRRIEDGKLTVPQFRELWQPLIPTNKAIERNQGSRFQLWLQHESRRFDAYNSPPQRDSPQFLQIDRMAKFSDTAHRFASKFGVSPDSIAVQTILAPYWKQEFKTRHNPLRPRPVDIRSIKRDAGSLSLLRVRGVSMRSKGLRRHIEEVDKSRYSRISDLNFQVWLATQYMEDPLDGEDMTEWIAWLSQERRRVKHELGEMTNKLEVQRRILLRRKAELERTWEWRYKRQLETIKRRNAIHPKPLLTLDSL